MRTSIKIIASEIKKTAQRPIRERMNAIVVLDWKFSPSDYFEEVIEISRHDYTMTIADGQVQAKIDSALYQTKPDMREGLHDALDDRFLAVQLLTHRPYELSFPTVARLHPDGRKDYFTELETAHFAVSFSTVEFRVTGQNGNVVADSKRDRIEKIKNFAELVASHSTDTLLASLLRSFRAAIRDPNNELVHLYEIREGLNKKFKDRNATQTALGISEPQWRRFGGLCCDEPLRQGRHRGKNYGALRDATEGELIEARGIARAMIEGYLQYLNVSSSP